MQRSRVEIMVPAALMETSTIRVHVTKDGKGRSATKVGASHELF